MIKKYNNVVVVTKPTTKGLMQKQFCLFRGILRVRSTDETRRSIMGVHVKDGRMECTDGTRLHQADNILGLDDGVWTILHATQSKVIMVLDDTGIKYPNTKQVMVDASSYVTIHKSNSVDICQGKLGKYDQYVSNAYLSDVLHQDCTPDDVIVKVHDDSKYRKTSPVLVKGEYGSYIGIIMPLLEK